MKSHTSMLGTFFVYTLALCMPIFKKKSRLKRLGKSSKLWVLHKKSFLCNTQSLELFPRNLRKDFFLKIGILSPKVYARGGPIQATLLDSNSHFRTSRPWLVVTFRPKKSNLAQIPRSRKVPEESLHIPLRGY